MVEDDVGIGEAVKSLLEIEGYKVRWETEGGIILKIIQGKEDVPNLVLMDVLLSGEDGREWCQKLKSNKLTKNVPIIMLSAMAVSKLEFGDCSPDGFLPKPFEIDDLLDSMKRLL
jgi:DNA-binding response OmpR family regulator